MKGIRLALAAGLLLAAQGCASAVQPLQRSELDALRERAEVRAVHVKSPTFKVLTIGKAVMIGALGGIGGGIAAMQMESEGKKMMAEQGLEDPALAVKERLATALESGLRLPKVIRVSDAMESDDVDGLARRFHGGLLLEVKTTSWLVGSLPGFAIPRKYGLTYEAQARLIRLDDRKVLWRSACDLPAHRAPTAAPLDDVRANSWAMLKVMLAQAAERCATHLTQHLLGSEPAVASASR
ncbi:MAG TPA: hypothetical protein VGT02_08210 [Methylomirabilota bacterium]|jgi:hypothetical protein|nr:hypothetical protein [Methylomirabilota bacterium]